MRRGVWEEGWVCEEERWGVWEEGWRGGVEGGGKRDGCVRRGMEGVWEEGWACEEGCGKRDGCVRRGGVGRGMGV